MRTRSRFSILKFICFGESSQLSSLGPLMPDMYGLKMRKSRATRSGWSFSALSGGCSRAVLVAVTLALTVALAVLAVSHVVVGGTPLSGGLKSNTLSI